jgi:hypothetical protein
MTQHSGVPRRHPELERLICAAVSNHRFATQLIAAPATALEHFEGARLLSPAERALVTSVNGATDIYDFAARLHACVQSVDR